MVEHQLPVQKEFYDHSSKVLTHFIKVAKRDENKVPLFIKTTLYNDTVIMGIEPEKITRRLKRKNSRSLDFLTCSFIIERLYHLKNEL